MHKERPFYVGVCTDRRAKAGYEISGSDYYIQKIKTIWTAPLRIYRLWVAQGAGINSVLHISFVWSDYVSLYNIG